jgi:NAD(P)H-dependent FMN reductase
MLIGLEAFPLPPLEQDLEAQHGPPANGKSLRQLFIDHDDPPVTSPQYNGSIAAVLKNAIDGVWRPASGEPSLMAFRSRLATLMSSSPGAIRGLRGLVHVRSILSNIGVFVLPDQIAVSKAHEAFNADGSLQDLKRQLGTQGLGHGVAWFFMKLKG